MPGGGNSVPGAGATPRIWLIVGDRLGDNAQTENLMAGLGLPYERRYVKVVDPWVKGKPKVIPSLHHLDLDASDELAAPWPDLVVTVGRRMSMVARWIREQSGGQDPDRAGGQAVRRHRPLFPDHHERRGADAAGVQPAPDLPAAAGGR